MILNRDAPVAAALPADVATFAEAARFVESLPYARTSAPEDKMSVMKERKGTCSTKHALLAALAQEQGLPHRLTLAFFEMSAKTHPQVSAVLEAHRLNSILEAHCMLTLDGELLDFTGITVGEPPTYLGSAALDPDNLAAKVPLHKAELARWARHRGVPCSADALWQAREACISALQRNASSGPSRI